MGTQLPLPKRGRSPLPNFRPIYVVAKWLDASRCHLARRYVSAQGTLCCRWRPSSHSPKRVQSPQIFGPFVLCPSGWMDQDGTWHGDGPRSRPHCARWGQQLPSPKGGGAPSPVFGSVPMWPHGWMHKDATCYGGRPQPGDFVLHGDPAPLHKRGWSPQFPAHVYFDQTTGWIKIALRMDVGLSPGDFVLDGDRARSSPKKGSGLTSTIFGQFYCGQTAGCIKVPLGMEVGLSPWDFVLDRDPAPYRKRGEPPIFGRCLLRPNGCMDQDVTWYGGRSRPRRHCVRWGPSSPSRKRGRSPVPNFRPVSLVAKRLDGSRSHLAWR